MSITIKALLEGDRPVILDGSTGANLTKRGMPAGVSTEKWVLDNPGVLTGLQEEYLAAGSDIVLAPTFGANSAVLSRHGLGGQMREFNLALAELSVGVCHKMGRGIAAADISPSGLFLRPFGDAGFDDVVEIFYQQALALEQTGIELYFIETQINLAETRATLEGLRRATKKPILVSMTIDSSGKTMSGNPLEACFASLCAAGASAVGCNCSTGPGEMLNNILRAAGYSSAPLIAKANAGMPTQTDNGVVYDLSPEAFADYGLQMAQSGIKIIGGCCGTTPEHIALLRQKLEGVTVPAKKAGILNRPCSDRQVFRSISELPQRDTIAIVYASPDIADDIMEAVDDGRDILRVRVDTHADADTLIDNFYMINMPLMLSSCEMDILEKVLRAYPGVALLDYPTGALTPEWEEYFHRTYGAIV